MVGPAASYRGAERTEPIRPVMLENPFCEEGCEPVVPSREPVVPSREQVVPSREPVHASARPRGPVRENPFVSGDQLSVANLRK
jgi:hypothetical protein